MTTTAPKPKPKRLSADQIANSLQTGEEWLGIHRLAVTTAALWWTLLGVLVVAAWLAAVQSGQAVSVYTALFRPAPPTLVQNLGTAPPETWTPELTRRMLPEGWSVLAFTSRALTCSRQVECGRELRAAWGWWLIHQPQNHAAQVATWALGGLFLLTLPALMLQADMRRWRTRETRARQRHERQARRSARGGRGVQR